MKQDISTMTIQQIERELKDFAWEYIGDLYTCFT
jgi:hypothetical protein